MGDLKATSDMCMLNTYGIKGRDRARVTPGEGGEMPGMHALWGAVPTSSY